MFNQAPEQGSYNAFARNLPLQEAFGRLDAGSLQGRIESVGDVAGSEEARYHAECTDRTPPILHRYDQWGNRVDKVERSASWHWLVDKTIEFDLHAMTTRPENKAAHAARAAMVMTWGEVSLPTICPQSANYSIVPALAKDPVLSRQWIPQLVTMDRSQLVLAAASLTERQGGSDVRQTSTVAQRQQDGTYLLNGLKWFVTCPWAEVMLVLARAPDGLTSFVVDSRQEGFRIERLKDKLGWHGLGVGEVELRDVQAQRLGDEGRGVGTIMQMITYTRLDVMLEGVASLRTGVVRSIHHARHRSVLGKTLDQHPLMQNVLADLALESEAATQAAMCIAEAYDRPGSQYQRIALSLMKYWITKRAAPHAAEALECLGGNGYVEASGMPRLLRDSVVGSVWEGSGNVAALDVLRAVRTSSEAVEEFCALCNMARGGDRLLDAWLDATFVEMRMWSTSEYAEWDARMMAERLALAFQASLLVRHAPAAVADAFCKARLDLRGLAYGGLARGADCGAILERAFPA
ncbi:MAG: acyl-CoA dehydrogenase family protein [Novosphingobium sp.]